MEREQVREVIAGLIRVRDGIASETDAQTDINAAISTITALDESSREMEQAEPRTLAFGLNVYRRELQRIDDLEERCRTWEAAALEMALAYIEAISLGIRRMTAVPTERERAAYRTVAALAAEKWRVSYPPRAQETSCPAE